ncbi:Type-1 restriction enzyme EcoKI specificity protein [Vreelandella boliviensis LC1]|uniref:Type-1 restriction enzyme EcoKI specificity protein n=1 Tax=Vreelandella boliviensis LC1 TaxID=1072583 RepID=A0A7U9C4E0_9GAMM|nr:Type-1 restriction enzyme EcoKI specificity protein [Halomonas boliviensis LC1]
MLAAAVSGRLTEEWRGTSDLTGWAKITLGGLVDKIESGKNLKCIETPPNEGEFGIIKISAVTWGIYDEKQSKTLPQNSLFLETRRIKVGDFLISRANTIELLGNPVIVHKVTKNLMLSDKVLRLEMKDGDKLWANIFLRSISGRQEIQGRSTGNQMSMRNIGQKALLEIPLPKPPCEEQTEIVRHVDQLFAHADRIEQEVNQALARVNNLTQSILAKAFRGEFTEQWRKDNPELISGENSASALLERIKAERATKTPAKRTRKKATV